jgi:hypothetical protein
MLDRLSQHDNELCGAWSRNELLEMDSRFRGALEVAFASGRERRESATATVRVDKPRLTEDEAIEAGWRFCCEQDFDVPFAAAVARVRVLLPNIAVECVRAGFARRFEQRFKRT